MIQKNANNIVIRVETLPGEHLMIRTLAVALLLSIGAYGYFVSLSIMNVVANREASAQSEKLRSTVVTLEQEYFDLSKSITPELGNAVGLTSASDSSFVRRVSGMASNAHPTDI